MRGRGSRSRPGRRVTGRRSGDGPAGADPVAQAALGVPRPGVPGPLVRRAGRAGRGAEGDADSPGVLVGDRADPSASTPPSTEDYSYDPTLSGEEPPKGSPDAHEPGRLGFARSTDRHSERSEWYTELVRSFRTGSRRASGAKERPSCGRRWRAVLARATTEEAVLLFSQRVGRQLDANEVLHALWRTGVNARGQWRKPPPAPSRLCQSHPEWSRPTTASQRVTIPNPHL